VGVGPDGPSDPRKEQAISLTLIKPLQAEQARKAEMEETIQAAHQRIEQLEAQVAEQSRLTEKERSRLEVLDKKLAQERKTREQAERKLLEEQARATEAEEELKLLRPLTDELDKSREKISKLQQLVAELRWKLSQEYAKDQARQEAQGVEWKAKAAAKVQRMRKEMAELEEELASAHDRKNGALASLQRAAAELWHRRPRLRP